MLTGAKLAEVASSLWNNVIVEFEDDASRGLIVNCDIELQTVIGRGSRRQRATYIYVVHGC